MAELRGLRVGLVGPVPPPSGGMANQLLQLARLLREEGAEVEVVPVNPPYRPAWIVHARGLRAAARLFPYVGLLRRTSRRVDLLHVLASSGWSWHLFAAPAIAVGRAQGVPVVVNYRGGGAGEFLSRAHRWIRPALRRASALVVPSDFLREVFARYGFEARVLPNVVDADLFSSAGRRERVSGTGPHILIARNLEPIYDVATGLRAFRFVLDDFPAARLTVAGSGPEADSLEAAARELGIAGSTRFVGRVENHLMPDLYREADVVLNPSLADNMPISILEALASGVPVVSTDVGGIPYLVRHGETALLTPARDARGMADAIVRLHRDSALALRQVAAGLLLAREHTWPRVRTRLAAVYGDALSASRSE